MRTANETTKVTHKIVWSDTDGWNEVIGSFEACGRLFDILKKAGIEDIMQSRV